MLDAAQAAHGYIFNLGHGVVPETDPESVRLAMDIVHNYQRPVQ